MLFCNKKPVYLVFVMLFSLASVFNCFCAEVGATGKACACSSCKCECCDKAGMVKACVKNKNKNMLDIELIYDVNSNTNSDYDILAKEFIQIVNSFIISNDLNKENKLFFKRSKWNCRDKLHVANHFQHLFPQVYKASVV